MDHTYRPFSTFDRCVSRKPSSSPAQRNHRQWTRVSCYTRRSLPGVNQPHLSYSRLQSLSRVRLQILARRVSGEYLRDGQGLRQAPSHRRLRQKAQRSRYVGAQVVVEQCPIFRNRSEDEGPQRKEDLRVFAQLIKN